MKKSKVLLIAPLVLMCCSFSPYAFGNVRITLASMFDPTGNISTIEAMSGQSFLIIKNDYSWPLDFGYFDIGSFDTVSVGLYMQTTYNNDNTNNTDTYLKKGIYYNREAYNLSHNNITSLLRGITTEISVGTFDRNIKDNNNRHLFEVYNDSYTLNLFESQNFALNIFNQLTGSTICSDTTLEHANQLYSELEDIATQTNQQVTNLVGYKENFFNFNISSNEKVFFTT